MTFVRAAPPHSSGPWYPPNGSGLYFCQFGWKFMGSWTHYAASCIGSSPPLKVQ